MRLTFVTVKWGVKYPADYVNILYDMVRRNLPAEHDSSFVCFTDDTKGIMSGIETRPLPEDLSGWWNKLYLFKPGVFRDGERVFFLDLDTTITGDISEIAAYRGDFAILRDFYQPAGLNSSLMLWRGGFGASIWQSYEAAGFPDISGGDQTWIERCKLPADILQDLYPGKIVSFKSKAHITLPAGVRIVCFHGSPRPHEVKNGWVEKVWKIGGAPPPLSERTAAHSEANPIENVRHAVALPFSWLNQGMPTNPARQVCIVGGGASAAGQIDELKKRKQEDAAIWALNGALQWLSGQGLEADAQVMSAAHAARTEDVPAQSAAMLFYASQCHPDVFEKAAPMKNRLVVWHTLIDGLKDLFGNRQTVVIGGGTGGMKAVGLAQVLGFGNIHLYGFDSSFPGGTPPGDTAANDENSRIEVLIDGRRFASSPRLAQQVNEYRLLRAGLTQKGVTLTLHGEGLLPYVAQKLAR